MWELDKNTWALSLPITADDIEKGVAGDCYACPIAEALRRYFPRAESVQVLTKVTKVFMHAERWPTYTFTNDYDARHFIREYDEPALSTPPPQTVTLYLA